MLGAAPDGNGTVLARRDEPCPGARRTRQLSYMWLEQWANNQIEVFSIDPTGGRWAYRRKAPFATFRAQAPKSWRPKTQITVQHLKAKRAAIVDSTSDDTGVSKHGLPPQPTTLQEVLFQGFRRYASGLMDANTIKNPPWGNQAFLGLLGHVVSGSQNLAGPVLTIKTPRPTIVLFLILHEGSSF